MLSSGSMVIETKYEAPMAKMIVSVIGTNSRWEIPLRNTTGNNTAIVVAVDARTGRPISCVASMTALSTGVPGSARCRVIFSRTTMASSTDRRSEARARLRAWRSGQDVRPEASAPMWADSAMTRARTE